MLLSLLSLFLALPPADEGHLSAPTGVVVQEPVPAAGEASTTSAAPVPAHVIRATIDDGLAYLARRQAETAGGSFPLDDADPKMQAPVGVTALGALAFMAAGNLPGRGPYGREVQTSIEYLIDHTNLAPESKVYGYISASGDTVSKTHGHGFATLALAQAYGMSPHSERLERALKAAVDRIEKSQGSEGGWEYSPLPISAHEGSVTICLVQALRAARNVGIKVDGAVIGRAEIGRAEDYIVRLQKPDGTFRYTLDDDRSTIGLTAAAVSTLNGLGEYDTSVIHEAVDAIWSGLGLRGQKDGASQSNFPFYERLYLAQAFWQLSDRSNFERWFGEEREHLIRKQRGDGSWRSPRYGSCYGTAVNCLVLAIPEGVLPIFQR